jgi:hypothetical protein
MATSGRINSGSANFSYFYFQWQLAGQDINGNYSVINWQWGLNTSNGAYWQSNAVKSVSGYINGGLAFGGNTWSNISGNGDHQLLAGQWTIGHESDGSKVFGMSSTGWLYANGNLSNSGAWDLPGIPRHATITGSTGAIDDETANYYTTYNNPAGAAIDTYLDLPTLGVGGYNRVYSYYPGNPVSMATDITAIRTAMANVNSTTLRYVIHDTVGGVDSWSYIDSTISIKNDAGQANPTFTDYTYKDDNATTVAITGNDQYLVQGYSDLLVTVSTGNKATPNKNATMDHYTVTIGGYSNDAAYSSGSNVTKDVGIISDVTGARTLAVQAVDSRGNKTAVSKTVNVLPYKAPVVSSTAVRANGYDDALILTVAGSVSPLRISSTDKNVVNSTSGVQYRVATDGGSYGSWNDVANTQTASTGVVNGNTTYILAAAGEDSAFHSFQIQVKITDNLNTTTQTINVSTGTPIFRIGTDRVLYYNEYPMSNPAVYSTTTTSSLTPDTARYGVFKITALASSLAIVNPTGAYDGKRIMIIIKDNGTARGVAYGTQFRNVGAIAPLSTIPSKIVVIGAVYNATDTKWDVVAVSQES